MPSRIIYEGSIEVSSSEYTHSVEQDEDFVDVAIDGLDEMATRATRLTFTLDYPFERPYQGVVAADTGISLRSIVDAVRNGFREMYRGARHEVIPNLKNQFVDGAYGHAVHAIDDLVIELIELDEEAGTLEIGIGS